MAVCRLVGTGFGFDPPPEDVRDISAGVRPWGSLVGTAGSGVGAHRGSMFGLILGFLFGRRAKIGSH
eukprot:3529558-Pyramimonas_sp.AAC.1